ncbi:MAG: hypothetical protein ACJARI_004337 [Bacteroidia bacterium]|jgi:hypothetical protein
MFLLVFVGYPYEKITVGINAYVEANRATTYLAIFYVGLLLYRTIDQHFNCLATIGTSHLGFINSAHCCLPKFYAGLNR